MKKICFILAGQLRAFDDPYVVRSWEKIRNKFDIEIVGCFWDNRGFSRASHRNKDKVDEAISKNQVSDVLKTDKIKLYNYQQFVSELEPHYSVFKDQEMFGCIVPHSYLRYQAWQMYLKTQDTINADIFVLTRADLIFLRYLDFESLDTDYLWHQNGQNHFPSRIYDIMLISNKNNIETVCSFFCDTKNSLSSINKPSHNGLKLLDSCRIYYNYLNLKKINVQSLDWLHADVFRSDEDIINYSCAYLDQKKLWGQ
jgi:hypothetical protein